LASKNAAGTSEANAAASATAANTSKVNAGTSESNAASSAAAALASKNAAGTSESNAATSAAAALTSKNNAATSEANAASSASASAASALVAQNFTASLAGKNRIINGDCRVAQRGPFALSTTAGTSAYAYGGPDRFEIINSAGGTVQQQVGNIAYGGTTYQDVAQIATAPLTDASTSKYWGGITQAIEGWNCADLIGKPVAISFLFYATVAGLYSVALRDGSGYYSYVTTINVPVPSVAQRYTILVPAVPAGAAIPFSSAVGMYLNVGALNNGTFKTSTLNAWQAGNVFVANGFVNWGLTTNAIIALSQLQLEAGSVATPFEQRPYGQELALCQRYYEAGQVNMQSPVSGYFMQSLSMVPKRAIPTVSFSNTTYGNGSALALNAAYISQVCFQFNASAANGYTNSQWTASAEL
jgi:hypothetical protein